MIFRKSIIGAYAGVAIAALGVTGCSAGNTSEDDPGSVLSVYLGGSGQFVENYNPFSPTVLGQVQGTIYEALFFFNNLAPLDSEPVPLLGEDYAFNADGTQITVTTKDGVEWSDGTPFTAKDVAFSFNLKRATPAINNSGNTPAAEATDDTHVVLTFDRPSFVEGPNALGLTYIVPEHIWKDKTDVTTDTNKDPVGTGPLAFGSFTGQSYLLEKSDTFRDADSVAVDGVRVFSLSGNQAATDKLLAGQLDWTGTFIPDIDNVLKAAPDVEYSATGSQQVVLNTCSSAALGCTGPQTSSAVRHAIYEAMDREQINKLAYFGKAGEISPTYALLERDEALIAEDVSAAAPMTPNIAEAQRLLQADGWIEGTDGIYVRDGERLSMTVLVTAGYTDYIATLEAMTQQLKAAGIEIIPQQVANNDNTARQGLGNYQLAISGVFQGPAADPYYIYANTFASAMTGPVGESINPYGNVARFASPEVDAAIAVAAGTEDVDVKAEAYAIIQRIIVDDMPYIPVLNNLSVAEFSTANYSGWPTMDDQYASASPASAPGNGVVLTRLTAK